MKYMYTSLIVLGAIAGSLAQVPFSGKCPDVQLQANFSIAQYMGKWYEMQRYFAIFEIFQNCVTADYSLTDGGAAVVVNNTGYNYLRQSYNTAIGDAIVPDRSQPAKLAVKFGDSPARGDYWVISTDYTSYTIVWSCSEVPILPLNVQFAWVLTRSPEPLPTATMNEVNRILNLNGIKIKPFSTTKQSKCP